MSTPTSPIIVALDYDSAAAALVCAATLDPRSCRVKIGKELFTAAGPGVVEQLMALGFEVFLDLKFHDIPTTVGAACAAAASLGVWMVNIHASGGPAMIEAAAESLAGHRERPRLIAVTVLTSMDDEQLRTIGIVSPMDEQVLRLARSAVDHGCDGVVCSARDLGALCPALPEDFLFVTPGIRPAGSASGDQRRVMDPVAAIAAGATYLVIGRPITRADDPAQILITINEEIADIPRRSH